MARHSTLSSLPDKQARTTTKGRRMPNTYLPTESAAHDSVRLYLRDIGRIPMQTEEEWQEISERIERLRAEGDEVALREAYEELVTANLRLVVSIAKRYTGCGVPLLDLIQAGNLGLMKAVEGFDFTRGLRLSTYASKWIQATITRYISNTGRTVRIPVNVIPMMHRLERATEAFQIREGRTPTIRELMHDTGMTASQVKHLLRVPQFGLSLDSPIRRDESDATLGDMVEDPNAMDGRTELGYDQRLEHLAEVMAETLDEREMEVLRLRYGLDGGDELTQAEIGERLNVSRQRVSQIESRALRRLRNHDDDGVLASYVN